MNTINRRKTQLSVAAVAALAIFAVAAVVLLSGGYATGSAQAQGSGGDDDPAPQLCGPGQDHFPEDPEEVASSGHYALFDAYWQPADVGDDTRTGALNDNLCPPAAAHTDVTTDGVTREVTTRSPSKIDVRTTIIQVKDKHKVDVVATNAEAGKTKLSLQKYREVRAGLGLGPTDSVPAGTKVHWLRLEDPALKLPPSDLVLGFSTGLLDGNYWDNPNPNEPTFEYEMESVRVIGPNPADLPHVLTYWEPEMRNVDGTAKVVWNGLDTDVNSMPMDAGEYEHLEWVFTKPGTYILQVHLKGHVRQSKPSGWDDDPLNGTWEKITAVDTTVTSEVKRFVFQVGDLHVNAQPHFGYHRTVSSGAAVNSHVGDPIPVYGTDRDGLKFTLAGEGHEDFKVIEKSTSAAGRVVQLAVANPSNFDYDSRPYYDLRLRVTDERDVEDNADGVIDDVAAVRINVLQQYRPTVTLGFLNEHPYVGDSVKVVVEAHGLPTAQSATRFKLYTLQSGGTYRELQSAPASGPRHEFTITHNSAGLQRYVVEVEHDVNHVVESGVYFITWRKES